MLIAKVVVAWTTPFVAKRVPLKVPMPRVVVVALVKRAFVAMSEEEKSVEVVACVAWRVVAKSVVVVASVVVAFLAVKSWKVEEAETARLVRKLVPETEIAVDDAYGNTDAVVEVAVKEDPVVKPWITREPRRSDEPATSKMLPVVEVALVPKRKTSVVSVG